MSKLDELEFARSKDAFLIQWKRVEPYTSRRELTKDPNKIYDYKEKLVETYNKCASLIILASKGASSLERIGLIDRLAPLYSKLKQGFKNIRLEYPWPNNALTQINLNNITESSESTEEQLGNDSEGEAAGGISSGENTSCEFKTPENNEKTVPPVAETSQHSENTATDDENHSGASQNTEQTKQTEQNLTPEENPRAQTTPAQFELVFGVENDPPREPPNLQNGEQNANMVMERGAFMALMAANIRQNYSGDPLTLSPFLASIELLTEMAEENGPLLTLLRKFILTKLEGYASEIMPTEINTIEVIVNTLKQKIKPENSKVVEGRMMALRADRGNLQDYAKKAEELADSLRRALVMDGIPLQKAEDMTIEKTIELCRSNAQNQVVKSVLASTKFSNPKEVIAKYVVESNTSRQEAQVLALRRFERRPGNGFNRGNHFGQNMNRAGRGNFFNNNANRGQNNGQWRGNYRQNNFNRGHFRGNYRNNNDQQNNRGNGNRGRFNNARNVRRVENARAPQSTLGDASE